MDPVRVGVVGAGAIAQIAHLPALARLDDVEVAAICDIDGVKARSLAGRFGVSDVFDDIEDLLKYSKPDAVVVCTPNHLHEIHVKTALSAGCHVLCERPLALSADGVGAVVDARRRAGKGLAVGMNYRFRNDAQAVRSFLEGGELGALHDIRAGWYTFRPARQALGWRRRREESGGGAMLDMGLGLIDLALWLSGCPKPLHVTASLLRGSDDGSGVEDAGCAMIRCEAGITIFVDVSWQYVGESERFWFGVHGTEGSATISPLSVFKALHGSPVNLTPTGATGRTSAFTASYTAQWASFLAVVRGDVEAPDLEDQLSLHRILEAVYHSARNNRTVDL